MSGGELTPPPTVLAAFGPPFAAARWLRHGGGFSGAAVFAGFLDSLPDPVFCLKRFPPGPMTAERLGWVHAQMRRAAGLGFVPRAFPTPSGGTAVEFHGRLWELTDWKPGAADFRDRPTDERSAKPCRTDAARHRAWRPAEPTFAPFPAVARRLAALREWRRTASAPRVGPELADLVSRTGSVLPALAAEAERRL